MAKQTYCPRDMKEMGRLWLAVFTLAAGCSSDPRIASARTAPAPVIATTTASAAAVPTESSGDDCPAEYLCDSAALQRSPLPRITALLVEKRAHRLHLVSDRTVVRTYRVALGSGGLGQKYYEGDHVTPIGVYRITGRYDSRWHTYLALDYPNDQDTQRWVEAVARGVVPKGKGPGSAIAIHGHRDFIPDGVHKLVDWTLGCVALDNDEIDEVASLAPIGTSVEIRP